VTLVEELLVLAGCTSLLRDKETYWVGVASLRAGRGPFLVAGCIAVGPRFTIVMSIITFLSCVDMSITTDGWLLIAPGAVSGTLLILLDDEFLLRLRYTYVAARLSVVPAVIALLRVLYSSVTASRWLRVSTWLDPFAFR
jgi:hypothetical protein